MDYSNTHTRKAIEQNSPHNMYLSTCHVSACKPLMTEMAFLLSEATSVSDLNR